MSIGRRITAEAVGTALLLACVVGSGVMAERLAGGSAALALLANTMATGAILVALIFSLAPISGAHLNPAVTLAAWNRGELTWRQAAGYVGAQLAGAFAGVAVAHLMFELPVFFASQRARSGSAQMLSEAVATFGLLLVIGRCAASRAPVALAVGAYITAAYWFTASTSFANPAVTLARSMSDTFAGIRPADVPAFLLAQLLGAGCAVFLLRWFDGGVPDTARRDESDDEARRVVPLHR